MNWNPESPWNPGKPAAISPENFEKQVVDWLQNLGIGYKLEKYAVIHRKKLSGSGGDYEFDAVVEFTILCGAQLTILVECKQCSRPIEREVINALDARMRDVEANKAMVFSTSGFQSGAIKYATSKKIALLTVVEGSFLYQTRSANSTGTSLPPILADLPAYAGVFMKSGKDGGISCEVIGMGQTGVLGKWIQL